MRTSGRIVLLMLLCISFQSINAQFFKKLSKKVSDAAENTVTDKSAQKTSDEVGNGMDNMFSNKNKEKISSPRKTYHFTYHYQLKLNAPNGSGDINYYLDPGSSYIAMSMNQNKMNMFMVYDYRKEASYNFMATKGRKMLTATSITTNYNNDWVNSQYNNSPYSVKDLPTKSFLGYTCAGKQLENNEWKYIIYYTNEVDINMQNLLHANTNDTDNGTASVLKNHIPEMENSLLMFFKVINKKKQKEEITMECKKLEKINRDFATQDYQSIN